MGKIVFISSVIFSFVFFILFIIKIRARKEKVIPEEVLEKPVVKLPPSNDTGVFMIPGIIILLLLIGYWSLGRFISNIRPNPTIQKRNIVQVQRQEKKQEEREERAVMYWDKPEGVNGRNPQKRSDSFEVIVKFRNTEILGITAHYRSDDGMPQKSRFRVTKRTGDRTDGTWSQENPSARGFWYLEPSKQDARILEGEISNEQNTFIPMRIEFD